MRRLTAGGGWPAIWYAFKQSRRAGGVFRMYRALRTKNACKTCALGMGGQKGGMVNERGRFPEVCKKSIQAMAADMQGAIQDHFFDDVSLENLRAFTPRELERSGRLTFPVIAGPLDSHYRRITWEEVLDRIVTQMQRITPDEAFFYFSGRSSNEAAFLMQLMARAWGTNNVSNCSYYCHQASGVALGGITGSGAATIVLEDLDGADLVFLIGANPASNHPRFMRSLVDLKRRGGKVIVVNPLKETGLVRFKVPSDVRSLLFGSQIADVYVQPHIGGDAAFLAGVCKLIIERGAVNRPFVEQHVDGWDEFERHLRAMHMDEVVRKSGVSRDVMETVAQMYSRSKSTIFAWAMGVTHHEHGVENIRMIANLAISRGMLGRPGAGLLPLRGHSNVQGIGSVGVVPALKPQVFENMQKEFSITIPEAPGMDTLQSLERAHSGGIRFASCLGGNLYGATPDHAWAAEAFSKIDTVVYLSTTLNTGHAFGRGRETIILPVRPRDEEDQPTTQESMFNYVRISDGGKPRHEGPRTETEVIADIAERLLGEDSSIDWSELQSHARIRESIGRVIPGYEAIGDIEKAKKEFQIAGRTFHEPRFNTPSGRAQCHVVDLPDLKGSNGALRLMTVRSEGQFNTVVYEEEDIYRGQDRRDVIMMNERDIVGLGLHPNQPVTVRSGTGELRNLIVRTTDIPAGNAVMYYPEANVLIPRTVDDESKTPSYKNTVITVHGQNGTENERGWDGNHK